MWSDGPPVGDDFFPSPADLALDLPDLDVPDPAIEARVYVNGELHFVGGFSSRVIVPPIYWSEGSKIRYTIFVCGQLFADEYHDVYVNPGLVAQRAAFADAAGLNGPNWATAAAPSWFLSLGSSMRAAGTELEDLSLESMPPLEQLTAAPSAGTTELQTAQLIQALSQFNTAAAGDSLPVSEPLAKRPIEFAVDV